MNDAGMELGKLVLEKIPGTALVLVLIVLAPSLISAWFSNSLIQQLKEITKAFNGLRETGAAMSERVGELTYRIDTLFSEMRTRPCISANGLPDESERDPGPISPPDGYRIKKHKPQ